MNLEGKIIDFLGDSITEGIGVTNIALNRYDNVIKNKCYLKAVYNYGISGTRIAHQRNASESPRADLYFCARLYDMNPEADIIVVYGGVNDYVHGDAPFGDISDKTPATFCGAVDFLMRTLKEFYPKAQIVFMTPAHLQYDTMVESCASDRKPQGVEGRALCEYVRIIEEKGKKYNIPVLNLFDKLPINPNIQEEKEKYTVDGLHFNDAGHNVLADLLIDFIKKI